MSHVSSVEAVEERRRSNKEVSVSYRQYEGEQDLSLVTQLIDNELSEPYSIFTYRFFLHNWPKLCWLAYDGDHCFGTVVSKQEMHGELNRGYIAMLVVESDYRGMGVGSELVKRTIQEMVAQKADEVVLEAEVTNKGALGLYQNLGFIRDKYLIRYYLSGSDAFRLKLMLPLPPERLKEMQEEQLVAEELTKLSMQSPPETPVVGPYVFLPGPSQGDSNGLPQAASGGVKATTGKQPGTADSNKTSRGKQGKHGKGKRTKG